MIIGLWIVYFFLKPNSIFQRLRQTLSSFSPLSSYPLFVKSFHTDTATVSVNINTSVGFPSSKRSLQCCPFNCHVLWQKSKTILSCRLEDYIIQKVNKLATGVPSKNLIYTTNSDWWNCKYHWTAKTSCSFIVGFFSFFWSSRHCCNIGLRNICAAKAGDIPRYSRRSSLPAVRTKTGTNSSNSMHCKRRKSFVVSYGTRLMNKATFKTKVNNIRASDLYNFQWVFSNQCL